MPPVRGPLNTKGLKTERTHEENQERAYIAASRRSDRSLEARIESARRASEIHKKRTGRALRVTEQDVINEEMYEEEDDDLQSQYRRLQAHLGSSADLFNGRLNAWVMSQYGARGAAQGLMFNPTMNMQQPATPFFAYNPQASSPSGPLSPSLPERNQSYRQSPYPQQYHRMQDQRSQSISSLPETQGQQGLDEESAEAHRRRHSMAIPADGSSVAQGNMARPQVSRDNSSVQPGYLGHTAFSNDQHFIGGISPQFNFNNYSASMSSFDPMMTQAQNPISPLTTALPVETQQIIGTSFEPENPFTPLYMNMSHGQPVPSGINYTYRPNAGMTPIKSESEGIHQTLSTNPMVSAPPRIDTNVTTMSTPDMTTTSHPSIDSATVFAPNMTFDGTFNMGMDFDKTPGETNSSGTPNDTFFNEWVAGTTNEEITQ